MADDIFIIQDNGTLMARQICANARDHELGHHPCDEHLVTATNRRRGG